MSKPKYAIPIQEMPPCCDACSNNYECEFRHTDMNYVPDNCPIVELPNIEKMQAVVDVTREMLKQMGDNVMCTHDYDFCICGECQTKKALAALDAFDAGRVKP